MSSIPDDFSVYHSFTLPADWLDIDRSTKISIDYVHNRIRPPIINKVAYLLRLIPFPISAPPEIPSYWRGVKSRFNIPYKARTISTGSFTTIVQGSTLHLKCNVVGFPKPAIRWVVFNSAREQRYNVFEDGTLVVPNADLEDEGNYTCIANNSYGTLRRTTTVSILSEKIHFV